MTAVDVTPCAKAECREPSHVVLYGNPHPDNAPHGSTVGGKHIEPYEAVGWCLLHGGQIYDAVHRRGTAEWLAKHDLTELPVVKLPDHPAATADRGRPYEGERGPRPPRSERTMPPKTRLRQDPAGRPRRP